MSYQRDDGHAAAAASVSPQIRMLQLEAQLQEQRAENADLRASVSATDLATHSYASYWHTRRQINVEHRLNVF